MAGEPVQQEAAHTAQRQLVSSGQESPPALGEGLSLEVGVPRGVWGEASPECCLPWSSHPASPWPGQYCWFPGS